MEHVQKFKKDDSVFLSGSYTGLGDVLVRITDINYSEMHNEFFYDSISNEGRKFSAAEKFHTRVKELNSTGPKKLIRSKIINKLKPEEWEEICNISELNKLYALKLHEELIEVQRSNHKDMWEFVDLLEAAFSFARINGYSFDDLMLAMLQKRNSNGSFECIALTNLNPNNPSNEIYFDAAD